MIASIILASIFKNVATFIVVFGGIFCLIAVTFYAATRNKRPINLHRAHEREKRGRPFITEDGKDPLIVGDVVMPPQATQAKYPQRGM